MTQDHNAFPNITKLVHQMSHNNGGTAARNAQGLDPDADREAALDECLGADGVYFDDLKALDDWLGNLTEDQFNTVSDGEHDEIQALLALAPKMGEESASDFIDILYEATV